MRRRAAHLVGGVALALAQLTALPSALHRWCLTWGAKPEEVERRMPGDDLLPEPDVVSTRVISVQAPPDAIWPWLVQLGEGRGGAGTSDWFENLVGLDLHSAVEIMPEFQRLKVGDVLPVGAGSACMRVEILEPGRVLALRSGDFTWVWVFALYPEARATRLVSRNRIAAPSRSPLRKLINVLILEPSGLLVERTILRGIKQRAERSAVPADRSAPAGRSA